MSAPMKMPRINQVKIVIEGKKPELFLVTPEKAKSIRTLLDADRLEDFIPAGEVLRELYVKTGKAGTVLRGLRVREGLTQAEFARKIDCPQSWVSGWETGKRALGRKMARKIAKVFRTDYRIFL
jgi:DNA-binding XRE family transcriptional regulator